MVNRLEVRLGDSVVATLARDRKSTQLEYDSGYRLLENAIPLSMSLPLAGRRHAGVIVDNYLDNLLPDSSDARLAWARQAGVPSTEPMALLAAYGTDVAGAFSFHPPGAATSSDSRTLTTDEIATVIKGLRADSSAWHGSGEFGRFSLAGAQAKTSLAYDGRRWNTTSGTVPSTHILKPALPRHPDSDLVEHVTMTGARRAGIAAAETWIGRFASERCLVVTRFDRAREFLGAVLRVHQEDFTQALGLSRLRKYEVHGGPTPEAMLSVLNTNALQWAASAAKTDFLKQLAFNWFVANTDAHAKNYSMFVLPDRHVLTPAYDVISYLPYIDAAPADLDSAVLELKLSSKVGGSYAVGGAGRFEWSAINRRAAVPEFDLVAWLVGTIPIVAGEIVAEAERLLKDWESPTLETYVARIEMRARQALDQLS